MSMMMPYQRGTTMSPTGGMTGTQQQGGTARRRPYLLLPPILAPPPPPPLPPSTTPPIPTEEEQPLVTEAELRNLIPPKRYPCPECAFVFTHISSLSYHLDKYHPKCCELDLQKVSRKYTTMLVFDVIQNRMQLSGLPNLQKEIKKTLKNLVTKQWESFSDETEKMMFGKWEAVENGDKDETDSSDDDDNERSISIDSDDDTVYTDGNDTDYKQNDDDIDSDTDNKNKGDDDNNEHPPVDTDNEQDPVGDPNMLSAAEESNKHFQMRKIEAHYLAKKPTDIDTPPIKCNKRKTFEEEEDDFRMTEKATKVDTSEKNINIDIPSYSMKTEKDDLKKAVKKTIKDILDAVEKTEDVETSVDSQHKNELELEEMEKAIDANMGEKDITDPFYPPNHKKQAESILKKTKKIIHF